MSWIQQALAGLREGRSVQVRPRGKSMSGRIEDGELVTLVPVAGVDVAVGDVVLVKFRNGYLLHLVKAQRKGQLLIGNNRGQVNGWVHYSAVCGKVLDQLRDRVEYRSRLIGRTQEMLERAVVLAHEGGTVYIVGGPAQQGEWRRYLVQALGREMESRSIRYVVSGGLDKLRGAKNISCLVDHHVWDSRGLSRSDIEELAQFYDRCENMGVSPDGT